MALRATIEQQENGHPRRGTQECMQHDGLLPRICSTSPPKLLRRNESQPRCLATGDSLSNAHTAGRRVLQPKHAGTRKRSKKSAASAAGLATGRRSANKFNTSSTPDRLQPWKQTRVRTGRGHWLAVQANGARSTNKWGRRSSAAGTPTAARRRAARGSEQ